MNEIAGIRHQAGPTPILDPTEKQNVTGSGIVGSSGPAPDPNSPTYTAILQSLAAFMPQISSEAQDVLLAEVVAKMRDIQDQNNVNRLLIDEEKKRSVLAAKRDSLEESTQKIKDAVAKEESASIWDKISTAFQALGAALMIVGGALLVIAGAGPVGALLVVAGVMTLIMVGDAMVKQYSPSGLGIAGNIALLEGHSKEDAAKADMGFAIAIGVCAVAASIVAMLNPAAALSSTALLIQNITSIGGAAISITTATGDVAAGVVRWKAGDLRADSRELQADAKVMEALMKVIDDFIDQVMTAMKGAADRFNEMIDVLMENIQDQGNTLARAKFTG